MSIRKQLNDRGRVIRTVSVVAGEPVIDSSIGDWMPFNAVTPRRPLTGLAQNPRTNVNSYGLQWAEGYRDPGSLGPGYRVELSTGPVLEILAPPLALKEATERVTGWAANAQDITVLYPYTAELNDPGETGGQPIVIAIWEFREDQQRMGRFEQFRGRVPIEFKDIARVNHEIVVGTDTYKINEGITNLETMTIDLVLIKPHG